MFDSAFSSLLFCGARHKLEGLCLRYCSFFWACSRRHGLLSCGSMFFRVGLSLTVLSLQAIPSARVVSCFKSCLVARSRTSAQRCLTLQFVAHPLGDSQLCVAPQSIYFTGEVFGELGWVDHQQGFVIGMSGRGRPIEWASDHGFVIDHVELVMQLVATNKMRFADSLQSCRKWSVFGFQHPVTIGHQHVDKLFALNLCHLCIV